MDNAFRNALAHTVGIWIETERAGDPNVSFPISKLEGVLSFVAELERQLHAITVERDAALVQMRENASRMDEAEARLDTLTDG